MSGRTLFDSDPAPALSWRQRRSPREPEGSVLEMWSADSTEDRLENVWTVHALYDWLARDDGREKAAESAGA
jgi:hypothetical protein